MGVTVRLKKTAKKEIPASQFCVAKNGCEEAPVVRLKEAITGRILDLCNTHKQALMQFIPHGYTKLELPEGNRKT